jgi:adenylate cyclase
VLLFVSVITIMGYTYYMNTAAVLNLSHELMNRVRANVVGETKNLVHQAIPILNIGSKLAARDSFPLPGNPTLESYSLGILQSYRGVVSVIMADTKGNFMMLWREASGEIAIKSLDLSSNPPQETWKRRSDDGKWKATSQPYDGQYKPLQRPWFKGAKDSEGIFWTDVYEFFTDKALGITAAQKVVDTRGKFLGVFGIDVRLSLLSDFLSNLKVGETGLAFIINSKDQIVAFPKTQSMVKKGAGKQGLLAMHNMGLSWLDTLGGHLKHKQDHKLTFEHQGTRYLATLANFPSTFVKDWKIVIVVPENDFIGSIKQTNYETLLFAVLILAISLWLGAVLANSIARPIHHLIVETKKIKNFELDGGLEIKTHLKEIQQMKQAFTEMKASLLTFTKFAPEEVVREVVAQGGKAVMAGEKRQVSVLFCDLRGFTGFAEATRAEEVVDILNAHFDEMVLIISQHHGFVCDFLGDSVFAVFGAPGADDDHAKHAVQCALRMQLARRRLDQETALRGMPPLEMGIGINSGVCVVGNMGSQLRIKYGIVGHAVNLGARIESFSVGGQVLISENTRQIVGRRFHTEGPYMVEGKGVGEPIEIWEVRGYAENQDLVLPPLVPDLSPLPRRFKAEIRQVKGKAIASEHYPATVDKLSLAGASLITDLELAMFASIQLLLPRDGRQTLVLDARVVAVQTGNKVVAKFSGLGPQTRDDLGALLRDLDN